MRNMIRALVLTTFSVGLLSACGPASELDEAPSAGEASQVEAHPPRLHQLPGVAAGVLLAPAAQEVNTARTQPSSFFLKSS